MKRIVVLITAIALAAAVARTAEIKLPPITDKTLDNGLDVIVIENHELPVVNLNMVIRAGSVRDPAGREGLADFTVNMLSKGTKTRSAVDIAEEIDFVGGSLNCSADRDAAYITSGVLVRHFETALNLLSDVITNPVFKADEIERLRKKTISEIIQSRDNPSKICADAFDAELFGSHPYGHAVEGLKGSIDSVTRGDVTAFYDAYIRPNNSFMVIAGDIDPDEAISMVSSALGGWEKKDIPPLEVGKPAPVSGRHILLINKPDATQTQIRFGNIGITRQDPGYYPFIVMNYVLGAGVSFVNRLMQQVRDEAGLTYDIRTVNQFDLLPGAFYCATFTENDSTLKAINAAMGIINDMAKNPISDEEYNNAVNFYNGYYPTTLETPSQVANEIIRVRLFGLPDSYIEDFRKNLRKVTKSEIKEVAGRLIDTDNLVIVVVSKAEDVEANLRMLGPVTVKSIDDL